jgi:prophage DNA circulation protein
MSQISQIINPWRLILLRVPASWRGVMFHVESGNRTSGRRVVTHEYPKRDLPYGEDMGRHARRLQFSGYLIYRPGIVIQREYTAQRDALMEALEQPDAGQLIHPVFARSPMQALCERYTATETREKGGFTQFDMSFVEAGTVTSLISSTDTASTVATNAGNQEQAAVATVNSAIAGPG